MSKGDYYLKGLEKTFVFPFQYKKDDECEVSTLLVFCGKCESILLCEP